MHNRADDILDFWWLLLDRLWTGGSSDLWSQWITSLKQTGLRIHLLAVTLANWQYGPGFPLLPVTELCTYNSIQCPLSGTDENSWRLMAAIIPYGGWWFHTWIFLLVGLGIRSIVGKFHALRVCKRCWKFLLIWFLSLIIINVYVRCSGWKWMSGPRKREISERGKGHASCFHCVWRMSKTHYSGCPWSLHRRGHRYDHSLWSSVLHAGNKSLISLISCLPPTPSWSVSCHYACFFSFSCVMKAMVGCCEDWSSDKDTTALLLAVVVLTLPQLTHSLQRVFFSSCFQRVYPCSLGGVSFFCRLLIHHALVHHGMEVFNWSMCRM